MITLFFKYTSGLMQVRKDRLGHGRINITTHNRLWTRRTERGNWWYSLHPWRPFRANTDLINHHIHIVRENKLKYLTSVTDIGKGLAVAMSKGTSRIKEFRLSLKDAILYSYFRDIRFVMLTCLLIGTSMWWMDVPLLLFQKTVALQSPDPGILVRVMKDVYINHICTTHAVPSPCECGEPLNRVARELFQPESFDPLHMDKKPTKRAIAFHVATIILVLALTESVSRSGFLIA